MRRVLHAIRRLQTDMPLGSERSSGSRVRFPVITTRLMFVAATVRLLSAQMLSGDRVYAAVGRALAVIAGNWAET